MLRKTVLSLKSPTGAFIVPLRFTNAKFFKDKTNREIRAYFAYALKFLEGRQRPDTFLSAVVHMDEKTPHLHLCFVPLTADGRLSAKGDHWQPQKPCEVAGRVLAAHGQAVPGAGTG